ncbi:MAG: glycosyltransferase family 4 protein, partial [Deltaproteobacteria bacterium]|nr:glycosyltransferase family 4 protein [Deltaproteobacteria bacterium]
RYDIIHDNQSLSYSIGCIRRIMPTIATIHHPITIDRDLAIRSVSSFWHKLKQLRWYSFVGMQKRVSRALPCIITVSNRAREDISQAFRIPREKFRVIPNGIDTARFCPSPGIRRQGVIALSGADMPLKGLKYLLKAVAKISGRRKIRLTIVGRPPKDAHILKIVKALGLQGSVNFTGTVSDSRLADLYSRAAVAVIPSVYEGFGFPAGEAMACATPVISTTAGALPELVGDAGLLVPPADSDALAHAIVDLLDHPQKAASMGQAGFNRIHRRFTWQKAARQYVEAYQEVICDYHRLQ